MRLFALPIFPLKHAGNPITVLLMPIYALNGPICTVGGVIRLSKILQCVVGSVSVDMIDQNVWPNTMNEQPSQPMNKILLSVNAAHSIPIVLGPAYFLALGDSGGMASRPSHYAGILVIGDKLPQFICGQPGLLGQN